MVPPVVLFDGASALAFVKPVQRSNQTRGSAKGTADDEERKGRLVRHDNNNDDDTRARREADTWCACCVCVSRVARGTASKKTVGGRTDSERFRIFDGSQPAILICSYFLDLLLTSSLWTRFNATVSSQLLLNCYGECNEYRCKGKRWGIIPR
jgi:hypothetical protein